MSDLTREQAIIQLEYRKDFATPDQIEALDMAISALSENKGEWEKIWRTDCECSEYVCSKCGCGEDYRTDFCPNCGADMREPKGEKGTE